MTRTNLTSLSLAAALLASGCAASDTEPTDDAIDDAGGKADQISGNDDPSGLLSGAERRLSLLATAADVGTTFGVDDDAIPYPDTYWPMVDNGIAVEWLPGQPSPLAKFVGLTSPSSVDQAIAWEIEHHGEKVPNVADWFGHCPGWVAAATLTKPVTDPVWVKAGSSGLEKCAAGDASCTVFEIGDVNAIAAELHEGAVSRFIGARCDTEPSEIKRDEFGRIVRNGTGCKGLNAGAMIITMGNLLRLQHKAFAIDAQNESNTDQIWNQPAYRYTVNRVENLDETQAANLVASGGASRTGTHGDYTWNSSAAGFAFVDVTLHWVSETSGPNRTVVSGAETTRTTRMVAVIELDRDASDASAKIIGGEYLDDARVGANRLRVAPFAWLALDVGPDFRHNPFVTGVAGKQLLALAADSGGGGGGETCDHDLCDEGSALTASCDSCATTVCAADDYCCNNSWDATCVSEVQEMCAMVCE
jgi:hypothetical protein